MGQRPYIKYGNKSRNLERNIMANEEKYIGYLRYYGESSVKDGLLDMRKSAEALVGFDEILRHFLVKEDPSLLGIEFEIPVRIRKGSWEAVIPEIIDKLLSPTGIGATALTTYATITAKKAAEVGLFNTGAAKDIKATFRAAIKSAQWIIKIASHVGTLAKKQFENAKVDQAAQEVKIANDRGEYLAVPKKYLDLYSDCPKDLFSKNAGVVESERSLEIGVMEDGKEKKVSITEKEKVIFYKKAEDDEGILFPELKHGQSVELEGGITRGNEKRNTLGFEYQEHILSCKPAQGTIADFKSQIVSKAPNHIFPKVKILGMISRADENGVITEKRPTIVFSKIVPLENGNGNQPSLM